MIVELTSDEIIEINKEVILFLNKNIKSNYENHSIRDINGINSCIGSIFFQSMEGYLNTPIEKMAGLLLYRIAQGQFFENGNKRTALISCLTFLRNNNLDIKFSKNEMEELIVGFAEPAEGPLFDADGSIDFIKRKIYDYPLS